MLRRRFLMLCQNCYCWIRATVKAFLHRTAKMESASAVEINADKETQTVVNVPLRGQNVSDLTIDNTAVSCNSTKVESVDAEEFVIKPTVITKLKALFVSYRIGEIHFVKTIITKLFAKGDSAVGKEVGATDKNLTVKSATVGYADTTEVETSDTSATSTDLIVSTAGTTEISATDTGASASKGKLVYWIEPVFEDGVLTIRSVYNALQTDETLEVM